MAKGVNGCGSKASPRGGANAHPIPVDRPDGYDRYHRLVATTDQVADAPVSFDAVLDRLQETRGNRGLLHYWDFLIKAAVEVAAPQASAYEVERMVDYCGKYRACLLDPRQLLPQPAYAPVTDSDAARLRVLVDMLQASVTQLREGVRLSVEDEADSLALSA